MPCTGYDDNGKLVTVIAEAGEKLSDRRADEAVRHPKIRFVMACLCEKPHQGLADATECENGLVNAGVLFRPGEIEEAKRQAGASGSERQRQSHRTSQRKKRQERR